MSPRSWIRDGDHVPEIDPPDRRRLILGFTVAAWTVGLPMFMLAVEDLTVRGLAIYALGGLIAPLTWLEARRTGRFPGSFPVAVNLWVMSLALVDDFYVVASPVIVVSVYAGAAAVLGPRFALLGGVIVVASSAVTIGLSEMDQPVDRVLAVAMAVAGAGFLTGHTAARTRGLRRELAEALSSADWEATHDSLTGLANRRLLLRRLEGLSADRRTSRDAVWFAVFDLDGFKGVNDAHGHEAGDRVLQETARRLRAQARETDLVVRMGGDEFAIVFVGHTEHAVAAVLDRLQRALARPIDLPDGHEVALTVSVGAASLADAATFAEVIAVADGRMYEAKRVARRRRR